MRVTSWQPFHPMWNQLQQFQHELNRLFERWTGDGSTRPAGSFPAANLWEDAGSVYVEAELPGVDRKDLEIYVTGGNQLTIKGERKPFPQDGSVCHRQERGFGSFLRVLTLPFEVNRDSVDARLENGLLQVKLAKHESAKPRKITVKAE